MTQEILNTEAYAFSNSAETSERNRLISRRRSRVDIDPERNYLEEAAVKYAHFHNYLLQQADAYGGTAAFCKYLASRTSISLGTIQRIISRPDNTKTNIYYINEICEIMDVSLDEVFDLHPEKSYSSFRYDLATYITLMRNSELPDEQLLLEKQRTYEHNEMMRQTVVSTSEESSYRFILGCIDREIHFVNQSMEAFINSDRQHSAIERLRLKNRLMPYRFRLVRRDYTNSTSQLASALQVRKEILSFRRLCQHIPRVDTIIAFCLIYDISLDYLLDSRFVFRDIKDPFTRDLLRRLSLLDYNVCGIISKIAVLEREGHANLSMGLITSSSVSNKKLKSSFADEVERAQI